jgi:ribosomal protein L37AE/L43A
MVGAAGDHGSHSGPESRNKDHQNVNQQEQYKQNCHYEVQRARSLVAS